MGSYFNKKCNQIDILIELYEKHQNTTSSYDRIEVIGEILDFLKDIKIEKECEEIDKEMGGTN